MGLGLRGGIPQCNFQRIGYVTIIFWPPLLLAKRAFTVPESGSWEIVRDTVIGKILLKKGTCPVVVKALNIKNKFVGNLREIRFIRQL